MLRYVGKRLIMMIPVVIGISFIIFAIMNLTPGDPARLILGPYASNAELDEFREAMGLNGNFFVRYFDYMKSAFFGDFGQSYRTRDLVTAQLLARIPCTLTLSFGAAVLMIIIGIPVGVISAVKQYSVIDRMSVFITMLLTSMPAFWLGLMLIIVFSLNLGMLPPSGVDSWKSFILPCITLTAALMAGLVRMTRSSMLEIIRQDYIRTARAKGAGERRVVFKHALRNALLPVVTVIGINFGIMMGGSIVTESVFALPGIGTLLIESVRMKDTPVVMAIVMFVALSIGIINLLVDITYAYIDPRIKSSYKRVKR